MKAVYFVEQYAVGIGYSGIVQPDPQQGVDQQQDAGVQEGVPAGRVAADDVFEVEAQQQHGAPSAKFRPPGHALHRFGFDVEAAAGGIDSFGSDQSGPDAVAGGQQGDALFGKDFGVVAIGFPVAQVDGYDGAFAVAALQAGQHLMGTDLPDRAGGGQPEAVDIGQVNVVRPVNQGRVAEQQQGNAFFRPRGREVAVPESLYEKGVVPGFEPVSDDAFGLLFDGLEFANDMTAARIDFLADPECRVKQVHGEQAQGQRKHDRPDPCPEPETECTQRVR